MFEISFERSRLPWLFELTLDIRVYLGCSIFPRVLEFTLHARDYVESSSSLGYSSLPCMFEFASKLESSIGLSGPDQHQGTRVMMGTVSVSIVTWFPDVGFAKTKKTGFFNPVCSAGPSVCPRSLALHPF